MDDLISRQAAIVALCKAGCDSGYCGASCDDVKAIEQLPSVQETHEERTETHACDLIDRQAAIAFVDCGYLRPPTELAWSDKDVVDMLKRVPSVQPEVIRCKDCKHMEEDKIFHQCWCNGREVKYDHFCGYAERRQE